MERLQRNRCEIQREMSRSQSEVIGVVLLTAVVAIMVLGAGAVLIPTFIEDVQRPNIAVTIDATAQNVTIGHAGGDTLEVEDVSLILRNGDQERYALSDFHQIRGTDETVFDRGDRWTRNHGITGDRMEVLAIHGPSNRVIERKTVDVEETMAARFDFSPANPVIDETVTFDASESVYFAGDIERYKWDFDDGTTITTSDNIVTHEYAEAGTYSVNLTIETDDGERANRVQDITVSRPSPTASFTFDPEVPGVNEDVTFDATDSESPAGTIEEYQWDFDDGTEEVTVDETITHSFSEEDTYTVSLTVVDDEDETTTTVEEVPVQPSFFTVTITDTNAPITAGETLEVTVNVENTGSNDDTQTIELLNFTNDRVDSETVSLESGEEVDVSLNWETTADDAGEESITVSSDDDTDSVEVTIEEPPGSFSGQILDDDGSVVQEDVTFEDAEGNVLGTETPDIGGGYEVDDVEPGTYDITASAEGYEDDTVEDVGIQSGEEKGGVDFELAEEEQKPQFEGEQEAESDQDGNAVSEVTFVFDVSDPDNAGYELEFIVENQDNDVSSLGPLTQPESPQVVDGDDGDALPNDQMNQAANFLEVEIILYDDESVELDRCDGTINDRNEEITLDCG